MPFLPSTLFGPNYEPHPHHYVGKPFHDPNFGLIQKKIHLPISGGTTPIVVNAYVEWKETPKAHVYKAHVPGIRHDEVRVEVENGRELCIIGEKWVERVTRSEQGQFLERARGRFIQTLLLPENSNVHRVKAYMDNGALVINVPKY